MTHNTIHAILEYDWQPLESPVMLHEVEHVNLPLSGIRRCEHATTVCGACIGIWARDYVFELTPAVIRSISQRSRGIKVNILTERSGMILKYKPEECYEAMQAAVTLWQRFHPESEV